jgi:oxygen-independent coproporphyrinogen-3 oxidase
MVRPIGIYISVPFCKAKCTFCNFASGAFGSGRMQHYVDRLCEEIGRAHTTAEYLKTSLPHAADTLYFGGGTPSLLSAQQFRKIFGCLRGEFGLAPDAEITLECAPGQLSDETLEELQRQGMSRISFGIQSFVDRETAAVGRLHTRDQCDAEIARLRAAGVCEINVDLIAGLPHQTGESWQYSLERAIQSGAPHVSVYLLEVDDESRLGKEMLKRGSRYGAASVPCEDETAAWYQQACDALHAAGIHQYEISNFARAGHRSRHNLKYWQRLPYMGFGLDAHSMLPATNGAVRFANTSNLDEYLGTIPSASPLSILDSAVSEAETPEIEFVGRLEAFEESLFLGLRLNDGVDLGRIRAQFGDAMLSDRMPALFEVRDAGLLELSADHMRLTAQGRVVSNEVFSRLLSPVAA